MRIVTSTSAMQRFGSRWRREGKRVGLVPTMGYLHEGHLSLVRRARRAVGSDGQVVVSVYVNPTQFGPGEDFKSYPRNLQRDAELCRSAPVNSLFVPSDGEMYETSPGSFSTFVNEEKWSLGMEGAARPNHFRGVTTVVAKLFNIVMPNVAVFGAKDYQQAVVVRKMARDLNFPVNVVIAPTVREKDGLAMSSRNKYLSPEERPQAAVLFRALQLAAFRIKKADEPIPSPQLRRELVRFIRSYPAARMDYVEFFDPQTLQPVRTVKPGTHMALAVYVGATRLIDNASLR